MKSELIVKVADIPSDKGLRIEEELDPAYLGLTENDPVYFIAPVSVQAELNQYDTTIVADVKVNSRFKSECYRSLEPVERDWQQAINLDYDTDECSDSIDLGEDIRQEIILSLPMRVLSDAEMTKDKASGKKEKPKADEDETGTYRPFEKLLDLDKE